MIIKKIALAAIAFAIAVTASAQNMTAEQYENRYNIMVKNLGPSGVGIETLVSRWTEAYPEDVKAMIAQFSYYLDKSQSTKLVHKEAATFMGAKPYLTLQDSLGNPVNYFQETFYDDELFGKAQTAIDKAIQAYPDRLDLRFYRITALNGYEKESPDMTKADLKAMINYNFSQKPSWEYPGAEVDAEFFAAAIQEYCVAFFHTGTPTSYAAFKDISESMLQFEPDNYLFLDNLGSYHFVAEGNHKAALKYYNKVLKMKKDDMTAIQNCILIARKTKNAKMEKKYRMMMKQFK